MLLEGLHRQTLGEGVGHVIARLHLAELEDMTADKLEQEVHPCVNVTTHCWVGWVLRHHNACLAILIQDCHGTRLGEANVIKEVVEIQDLLSALARHDELCLS